MRFVEDNWESPVCSLAYHFLFTCRHLGWMSVNLWPPLVTGTESKSKIELEFVVFVK